MFLLLIVCVCVGSPGYGASSLFHCSAANHEAGQQTETTGCDTVGSLLDDGHCELTRSGTLLVYRPGSW